MYTVNMLTKLTISKKSLGVCLSIHGTFSNPFLFINYE